MLKWAFIFAAIAIGASILGFVVDVAGAIAKLLFFIFAIGAVAALVANRMRGRRPGGG